MIVIFNIKNDIYKYNIENKTLDKILDLNTEETIKILKVSKDDKLLSFITSDKYLFVYNLLDRKYIFKSKIINLDSSKIFFSSENENIMIYSYEGIEIYNIKNNNLINYIQDDTLKLCYDLKLLDSIETLLIIKNDFNVYFYKYKKSIIEITKTNISNTLFIEYNEIEDIFITINLSREIVLYDSNFNIISKSSSMINKNEEIKDFFINQNLNKLLIFGSKIWIFDYSSLDLINTIDTNIKNLQSSIFYNNKNYLCLCYHDFRIDIFDLNKGKKINSIKGLNEVSNAIEKNLNCLYLYLFGSESISIYSLKDKKVKNVIFTNYSTITASSNKKNTLIALYNMEKNITFFDINKNKMIKKIDIKDSNTFCLDLNEEASILAYKDGLDLIFLDTIDYKILNKIKTNNNYYSKAFKFSICCNKFLCLDTDNSLLIINISNFSKNKIDVEHKITDFICIGENIYSISNNEFFITNINNLKSAKYFTFEDKVSGLSYSSDLKNIFLCTKNKIYIFDISTNIIVTIIEIEEYLYAIQCENEILFGITLSGYIYYFNIKNGSFLEKYKISHPYENLNIQETTGLSKLKKDVIFSLGAII